MADHTDEILALRAEVERLRDCVRAARAHIGHDAGGGSMGDAERVHADWQRADAIVTLPEDAP
jgi:hypothetical protein